jgi:hypothetical protein
VSRSRSIRVLIECNLFILGLLENIFYKSIPRQTFFISRPDYKAPPKCIVGATASDTLSYPIVSESRHIGPKRPHPRWCPWVTVGALPPYTGLVKSFFFLSLSLFLFSSPHSQRALPPVIRPSRHSHVISTPSRSCPRYPPLFRKYTTILPRI